jgi:peroxiredoxin
MLPSLALPATDGGTVDLEALPGRSLVIVYPWTGRPGLPNPPDWDDIQGAHGSTPELAGFRDRHAHFLSLSVRLFGLSRQTTDYHTELVSRLALPFPILSDAAGRFAAALGLPSFTTGGDVYLKRLTLEVKDGQVERVFYPVPDPAGHADEVLRVLSP